VKSKNLVAIIDNEHSEVDDRRLDERIERAMACKNAEMGLARADGIGGRAGENEVGWSESRAGWSLAITTHFTRLVKRRELVRRAKTNGCPEKTVNALKHLEVGGRLNLAAISG